MLVLLVSAAGACQAVSAASLEDRLSAAEQAILLLDIGAFVTATDQLRESVTCVDDVLSPDLVARLHRVEGFRRFGDRDPDAVYAFAAARAVEPDWELPEELAPIGSPLRTNVFAVEPSGAHEKVPEPAAGELWIDGRPSRERPEGRPAVVQLVEGSFPRWTVYREADEPLPTYEIAPRGPLRRRRAQP